jgi:hypothetical protein
LPQEDGLGGIVGVESESLEGEMLVAVYFHCHQQWKYTAIYLTGVAREYIYTCPLLPVSIDAETILRRFPTIPRQAFQQVFFKTIDKIKGIIFCFCISCYICINYLY